MAEAHALSSDVELLHVVPDWVVDLCPVVRVRARTVLLFHAAAAAALLGLPPPALVEEAGHHSQRAHSDEDHCCDHS